MTETTTPRPELEKTARETTTPDALPVRVLDLGNNETRARGVFANPDGTFDALTFTESRTFKTKAGALRWYNRRTAAR